MRPRRAIRSRTRVRSPRSRRLLARGPRRDREDRDRDAGCRLAITTTEPRPCLPDRRRRPLARAPLAVLPALSLAGCRGLLEPPPVPGPEAFDGIAGKLGQVGVAVSNWTAGDAGCDDPTLTPTAIRFDAEGLDQATPVPMRIYIFRNHEAWDRRLADVSMCAAEWAQDLSTFEVLQVSPYVVAGQGPWPPQFDKALRDGIKAAAGSGG